MATFSTGNQLCTYRCRAYKVAAAATATANSSSFHSLLEQRQQRPYSLLRSAYFQQRESVQRSRGTAIIARAEDKPNYSSSSSSSSSLSPPIAGEKEQGLYEELKPQSGTCDPLCSVDEMSSQDFEANYQPKADLLKALAILASAVAGAVALNHSWVANNQDVAMALVFALGYAGIIFEESLAFNKSGVGLLMAVCLWVIRSIGYVIILSTSLVWLKKQEWAPDAIFPPRPPTVSMP